MKTRFLAVAFTFFALLNIFLVMDIHKRQPECERIHTDDADGASNVIPNEAAAVKIAEIRASREVMGEFGLVEGIEYDTNVTYNEERDEWCVSFSPSDSGVYLDAGAAIWLSGSYGTVNDFRR